MYWNLIKNSNINDIVYVISININPLFYYANLFLEEIKPYCIKIKNNSYVIDASLFKKKYNEFTDKKLNKFYLETLSADSVYYDEYIYFYQLQQLNNFNNLTSIVINKVNNLYENFLMIKNELCVIEPYNYLEVNEMRLFNEYLQKFNLIDTQSVFKKHYTMTRFSELNDILNIILNDIVNSYLQENFITNEMKKLIESKDEESEENSFLKIVDAVNSNKLPNYNLFNFCVNNIDFYYKLEGDNPMVYFNTYFE